MNMLRFNELGFLLILSILCCFTRPVLSDCRSNFVQGFDYFPDKVVFENDSLGPGDFSVSYHESYIIVTNNVVTDSETYVLYCTANPPTLTDVPANATKYIQVPVTNVAVSDPSDRSIISFLEILGEERSLKYVNDKTTITSPCLQKHNDLYDTFYFANTTQIEGLDVIFTHMSTLQGSKYVTVSFSESTSALRKADWIKFVSLFFNKTADANNAYDKIRSNYLCHLNNVSKIPKGTKKTISWVALQSDNTFSFKYTSFYTNITFDAAAFITNPQITDGIQSFDDLHQSLDDSYIVIDMSELVAPNNTFDAWKRYFGYDQVPVSNLPSFLQEKRLYRTRKLLNKNDYDDWTESSPSRPDLILQDLLAIQYPLYQQGYNVRWFDKLAEPGDNIILSADQCDDSTYGLPKKDFGSCTPGDFQGDLGRPGGNNNNDSNNDNNNDEKNRKVKIGVIIGVALSVSLVVLGLGAWLLVVARRKYRERFVKLEDEPVVQMSNVKEVK